MMKGEPVRVAHIIGKLNAAGVEAVVNNYYRHIDHNKYQFDYYIDADGACEPPQEMIAMGARYFVIPPYQKLPQHVKALIILFRKNQYKIVHSGMNTLAPISMYCAKKAGVPIRINHNHSTAGKGEKKKNLMKYCLRPFAKRFATHYAACSRYSGEWLYGKKMVDSGEVIIFNNAIDVDKYKYNEKVREEVRDELGLQGKFVVGHVGRFEYQKNHDYLINVFKAVYDVDNSAVLLLVGIGGLMDEIKDKVKKLGLTESVFFLGVRNDVNRLYQAMDVFVLPSRYEGLPVVGVEAQTAGLPCFFSDQMTKDAAIIRDTKVMSLTVGANIWAKEILKAREKRNRDASTDVRKAGFDIKTAATELENFYDQVINEQ